MKENHKKRIMFITINFIFVISLLLSVMQSIKFLWVPIVLLYFIYILLLNDFDIVYNQIVLSLLLNFIYDNVWRKTMIDVPFEGKYIVDIISLILVLRIMLSLKKYIKIAKDSFLIWWGIFVVISITVAVLNKISFINYIMALRIYIRFIPTYIILSNSKKDFCKFDYYILIILNLLPLPIFFKSFHQDDFSGLFGASNVQVFLLLISTIYFSCISLYIMKKIKTNYFVIATIIVFLLCGAGEIKIGLILIPISTLILILINTQKIGFIIKITVPIVIMILIGINIIGKINPVFIEFFDKEKVVENIENYTMKSNTKGVELGRLENIVYTHKYTLDTLSKKLIGLAIGSSMPSENWYYRLEKHAQGREIVELFETEMFRERGSSFGYHYSSMNIIYLETGLIGVIIYYLVLSSIIIRAFIMLRKSSNLIDKCVANCTIGFMIMWIPLMYYYWYLLDRNAVLMMMILSALTTKRYKKFQMKLK